LLVKEIPGLPWELPATAHLKEETMPSIVISGRPAWIAGIVLGVILLVVGLVINQTIVAIAGGVFLGLSLIFLILSFVTGGQSD
jgi:4-hydroxybenzoate polyprenyltransferase